MHPQAPLKNTLLGVGGVEEGGCTKVYKVPVARGFEIYSLTPSRKMSYGQTQGEGRCTISPFLYMIQRQQEVQSKQGIGWHSHMVIPFEMLFERGCCTSAATVNATHPPNPAIGNSKNDQSERGLFTERISRSLQILSDLQTMIEFSFFLFTLWRTLKLPQAIHNGSPTQK